MAGTDGNERPATADPVDPTSEAPLSLSKEAALHGITCVTIEHFEYGGYRYTSLQDAIAEARRREPRPCS